MVGQHPALTKMEALYAELTAGLEKAVREKSEVDEGVSALRSTTGGLV